MNLGRNVALALTTTRLLLGPAVIVMAVMLVPGTVLALAVAIAFLSDVFDGVVARRFGVATPGLRRYDSVADTVFYVCVGVAIWLTHRDVVMAHIALIGVFAVLQGIGHGIDTWMFGRSTSYHTWSGRVFGLLLFVACAMILSGNHGDAWLQVALVCGIVAHVDAFIISMILPEWRHDVGTVRRALTMRREILESRGLVS